MTEESFNEIIEKLNTMITESRNHHEILYYHIEDKIKLLAEGQTMTHENLERFKEYIEEGFNRVDSNLNMLIMQDSPSATEFKILKKQVRKLDKEVFG